MAKLFGSELPAKRETSGAVAGSTNKKVLISRFDRETISGFVNPATWLQQTGLELLTTEGAVALVPYKDVKVVSFVRDFEQGETRRELRTFASRPKFEGLWVRLRLRDGDWMDGVMPNDLLTVESVGYSMIPPDPDSQNQRVFVPRAAISEIRVLGVVGGAPRKPVPHRKHVPPENQLRMFGEPE